MGKKGISRILFIETFIIGTISLGAGLLLGLFFFAGTVHINSQNVCNRQDGISIYLFRKCIVKDGWLLWYHFFYLSCYSTMFPYLNIN